MPKFTLEEKRLETLRRQLQGKTTYSMKTHAENSQPRQAKLSVAQSSGSTAQIDSSYLRADLLKILLLAGSAILIEFGLYISFQHGLKIFGW